MKNNHWLFFLLIVFAYFLFGVNDVEAKEIDKMVTIGVQVSEPHVIRKDDGFYGFDISIIQVLLDELGWQHRYIEFTSMSELLQAVEHGDVDIGMAGISMTEEREKYLDFSHTYNSTGLRIMVNKEDSQKSVVFSTLVDSDVLNTIIMFLIYIMISSHLFWLAEHQANEQVSRNYFLGVYGECTYWSVVTASSTGYGDITAVTKFGKLISVMSIFTGFIFFAAFLGVFSSVFTEQKAEYDISSYAQLRGRAVATRSASTSVTELERLGSEIYAVSDLDEAYDLLKKKKVKAVVFDEINLLYEVKNDKSGKLVVVGNNFAVQEYGIAFAEGSSLIEPINQALLRVKKKGIYKMIYDEWFKKD